MLAKTQAPPAKFHHSTLLLSLFDSDGHGLEIGPGFNPLLPRSQGFDVETLDHASREVLVEKYRGALNVGVNCIEAVAHVVDGPDIAATVKRRLHHRLTCDRACHRSGGFLRDCGWLLQPGGKLVLAVPYNRFCFDALRPLTSTRMALQVHLDGRRRHRAGVVFDELAYNIVRNGQIAWAADAAGDAGFYRTLKEAHAWFEDYRSSTQLLDLHAWQFTPYSQAPRRGSVPDRLFTAARIAVHRRGRRVSSASRAVPKAPT